MRMIVPTIVKSPLYCTSYSVDAGGTAVVGDVIQKPLGSQPQLSALSLLLKQLIKLPYSVQSSASAFPNHPKYQVS